MTTPLEESLHRLVRDCEALQLQWALIGGFAVSARDDTARPQGSADLIALRQVLTEDDEADLRRLVRVVVERGYHRDRDLVALAETYIAGS